MSRRTRSNSGAARIACALILASLALLALAIWTLVTRQQEPADRFLATVVADEGFVIRLPIGDGVGLSECQVSVGWDSSDTLDVTNISLAELDYTINMPLTLVQADKGRLQRTGRGIEFVLLLPKWPFDVTEREGEPEFLLVLYTVGAPGNVQVHRLLPDEEAELSLELGPGQSGQEEQGDADGGAQPESLLLHAFPLANGTRNPGRKP